MKYMKLRMVTILAMAIGCSSAGSGRSSDDDTGADTDTDTDTDSDADSDTTVCTDGEFICQGGDVFICEDGEWVFHEDCDESIGDECWGGECVGACEAAAGAMSYIGCEYYATCLPGGNDIYAVALSNVGELAVDVTIERTTAPYGSPPVMVVVSAISVAPGSLETVVLPWNAPQSGSGWSTIKSYLAASTYHITSDLPVVVYQFVPYNNQATNDASILLPVHAMGKEYVVLAWPQTQGGPSFLSVVGTEDGTTVDVTPATDISQTDSVGTGTVNASPEGTPVTFSLDKGDILTLTNENYVGGDPARGEDYTGSIVSGSAPVAVFAGGSTVDVPHFMDISDWYCCADHIEQQIFPERTLGKEFVAARTPVRSEGGFVEPEFWRVLATVNGTTVTTTLPAPDDEVQLDRGEHVEFEQTGDFLVSADEPVLFGQFVSSGDTTNTTGANGDPAYILVPPHEQFRESYITLTPDTYELDFLIVTVPQDGTTFTIDGLAPSVQGCEDSEVTGAWRVYRCLVDDGAHQVDATGPVGLVVYGYQHHTSYGYSGGLDMEVINPIE